MKKGECKHYTGLFREECEAGLNKREVTGGDVAGYLLRMPCFKRNNSDVVCDSYEEPTDEEIRKDEEAWEQLMENMKKISPLSAQLKEQHPEGGSGTVPCPVCKNTLHFTVSSYNGHTSGRCETDGCIYWIE